MQKDSKHTDTAKVVMSEKAREGYASGTRTSPVTRMKNKLEQQLTDIDKLNARIAELEERLERTEGKVEKLETWKEQVEDVTKKHDKILVHMRNNTNKRVLAFVNEFDDVIRA